MTTGTTDDPAPPIPQADRAPDIHTWFGLSYASYLVVPRTLLQSMPDWWQRELTALLGDLDEAFAHVPQAPAYKVTAAEEREVAELTPGELAAAGVAAEEQPCEDDHEHGPGCLPRVVYSDLENGRELASWERVLLPVPEPVPPYNRGRARVDPAPGSVRRRSAR